ncbi:hypothetical protein SprV_0902782000 [Sparganum proliferum]
MKKFLLRDQGCLRSAKQSSCSSSQHRMQYLTHREVTNPTAMDRALQRRPQPPLYHLPCRHRPSASTGDHRRPRPPALPPENHQGHAAGLQQESAGSDMIPAEIHKHGDAQRMDCLTALFQTMWRQEDPQDFKDTTIVHLR